MDVKRTHTTTSDTPIFMHMQSNSTFWLIVENLENDRQYDKIQNISYQRQVVKCHLFFIFTHF